MTNSPALVLADGLSADSIEKITTSRQLGELLAECSVDGRTVVPFGGGGSLLTGRPATADLGLDLRPCSGIVSYAPADLTLSVRAGTTWAEVQSVLRAQGQTLPLDIPFPDRTTIGGVVATGFAGARRYRQGSLRDLLIGCEYVRGDGLVANAGGMVVKNVSGFEIPRFLHGSWGALAVITSVNLKVVPRPRADGTAVFGFDRIGKAIDAGIGLLRQGVPLDSIAVIQQGEDVHLALRATGRPRAVGEILSAVSPAGTGSPLRFDDDESVSWWQATTDRFAESPDDILIAMTARIEHLAPLVTDMKSSEPGGSMLVLPGTGSIRVRVPHAVLADPAATVSQVRALAREQDASSIIESAPVDLRSSHDVWGTPDSGMPTMQAIKRTFDPAGILNRGRLFV